MTQAEASQGLVGLFEAKAAVDGRIRVEDLLSAASAAAGEACIAAAGEFDPEHHAFTPGAVVMSDRINAILCDNATDWAETGMTVFGIIRTGALAAGYLESDLPPLDEVFTGFAAGVGDHSAGFGFVALSVSEDHRPFVAPLRQAYELRPVVRSVLAKYDVATADWPSLFALALVSELVRVREAIDREVALRIVLETINGMSKTATMTDEAMAGAADASGVAAPG